MNTATIWTGAHCQDNPGPGAYAVTVQMPDGSNVTKSNGRRLTTPLRMELYAAIRGLTILEPGQQVTLKNIQQIHGQRDKRPGLRLQHRPVVPAHGSSRPALPQGRLAKTRHRQNRGPHPGRGHPDLKAEAPQSRHRLREQQRVQKLRPHQTAPRGPHNQKDGRRSSIPPPPPPRTPENGPYPQSSQTRHQTTPEPQQQSMEDLLTGWKNLPVLPTPRRRPLDIVRPTPFLPARHQQGTHRPV